jgi:hypothetical protein
MKPKNMDKAWPRNAPAHLEASFGECFLLPLIEKDIVILS